MKHPITKAIAPLILACCAHPEDCRIEEAFHEHQLLITVTPHVADYPIICGKKGKQINALKFVIKAAGESAGIDAALSLEDGFTGRKEPARGFNQNPEFDVPWFVGMVEELLSAATGRPIHIEAERHNDVLNLSADTDISEASICKAVESVAYTAAFAQGMIISLRSNEVSKNEK